MRYRFLSLLAFVMLAMTTTSSAQTARIQVIHNAADPAADSVDIYVNGTKALDNFAFRAASPFLTVPAGTPVTIGIAPWNSTGAPDTIASFTYTLAHDQKYLIIASGVLAPPQFADNPDNKPTGFTLLVKSGAIEAGHGGSVSLAVAHGATDAPRVDVVARGGGTLVDDAAYGDITGYLSVPPSAYTLDIKDASGSVTVASFTADLTGLADSAVVVFASGFLSPLANNNGELFGLFAALPNGTVIELPVTTARLQVIHNAADPAAAEVDIYLNGQKLLDNFAFRTATPFIDVPARLNMNIGVAPGTSTSFADTLTSFNVALAEGEKYVVLANGVLTPAGFAANPNGRNRAFTLFTKAGAREASSSTGNVQFFVVHGATDAPFVDVDARGVGTLVNNAGYGDITGYLTVPPASYTLDVKDSSGAVTVASFTADLSGLANGTATVFASGFLNPLTNKTGKLFGLFAALANGTVVELPATTARLQVIHNAADPGAASVDIYVNGQKLLDNFTFRSATPFIDVPARLNLNIGVAPGTSTSFADTLTSFNVALAEGEKYVALANGVLNPAGFAANPNGRSSAFTLLVKAGARESSTSNGNVQFFVVHGATDAPFVDVDARGVGTLVNNAGYGDITGYLTVPPASYTLDVKDSSGAVTVASFTANLSGLANGTATVFASGFLAPAANNNGAAFGLYAALANGTVVPFSSLTGVSEAGSAIPATYGLTQNYPNPFNPSTQIVFALPEAQTVRLLVFNNLGQQVASLANGQFAAGEYRVDFNAAGLPSGMYFYRLEAGVFSAVKRMTLLK